MVKPTATTSRHPLVLHKLTLLRSAETGPALFRTLVRDLTQVLFVEATADLRLAECEVRTPLASCAGHRLAERVGLVPILRAGLGMVAPVLEVMPEAVVWHLGLSAVAAVDILKKQGVGRLKFVGLIAAPEGVATLAAAHPDVAIHVGAVDSRLNEVGYIVPGLGDAGDRQFGTL
jgi:uracil phosphoribosyltransferase